MSTYARKTGQILGDFSTRLISYVQQDPASPDVLGFIGRTSMEDKESACYVFKSDKSADIVREIQRAFQQVRWRDYLTEARRVLCLLCS